GLLRRAAGRVRLVARRGRGRVLAVRHRAGGALTAGGRAGGPRGPAPGDAGRGRGPRRVLSPGELDHRTLASLPGDGRARGRRSLRGGLGPVRGPPFALVRAAAGQRDGGGFFRAGR